MKVRATYVVFEDMETATLHVTLLFLSIDIEQNEEADENYENQYCHVRTSLTSVSALFPRSSLLSCASLINSFFPPWRTRKME